MMRTTLVPLMIFASTAVLAEPLPIADPTRPPSGIGPDGVVGMDAGGSRLKSVVLPKKGKPMAVIGGQLVSVGEQIGDQRLIRLTESEAVLEGPDGVEHLFLTPDVDKKMNVTKAAARRKKE